MRFTHKPVIRYALLLNVTAILCLACAVRGDDPPAGDRPLKQIRTLPLPEVQGRIDHFALDEKGARLFMAALGTDALEVIDLKNEKQIDRIKGLAAPQGVAFAPAQNRLAVANDKDGSCRIYDGTTLKEIARIDLKDDADNVRYDSANACFWVGCGEGALASIDLKTYRKTSEIKLEGHPESFQLEFNGNRMFVNVPRAGHVAVIDRKTATVIDHWPLRAAKANFPMALDQANHRLFIGCRQPAKLLVLDTQSGKEIASIDCVGDTDDLFYDASTKRIYITGGAGAVDVVAQSDADHYHQIANIKTAAGARTAFFNPSTGKLYLAVPLHGEQKAELRVFQAERPN